ncbi:MAG: hypothetical protein AAB276_09665, partial [Pseudomonadota bacterium]
MRSFVHIRYPFSLLTLPLIKLQGFVEKPFKIGRRMCYPFHIMLHAWKTPFLLSLGAGPVGRWKLWAFASAILMIATVGTWIAGQYQIGRLDSVKKRYEQPVQNFAKMMADTTPHDMERDLLESCKH